MSGVIQQPEAWTVSSVRWPDSSATSECSVASAASAAALSAASRAAVATREAVLQRLCRVITTYRRGEPVRLYQVREPTPENLATVSQLLRRTYRKCHQTSGIAFVAA